tara:strand:- start:3556 stop:3801 length:246 start_codon:yes stop_codon:yes gene_type:complete
MNKNNIIGKYFKSKSTFTAENSIFLKGSEYQLLSVIEEEIFTLYIFKDGLMFGDYETEFKDYFIKTEDERIQTVNKILYED